MEGNAAVWIASLGSVFKVSLDGAAHLGQLAAYLVVTAGDQLYGQQVVTVGTAQQRVSQSGFFAVLYQMVVCVGFVLLLVSDQPVAQLAAFLWRSVLHDGEVGLFYATIAKQVVHPRQGLARSGKYYEAAHGTIETVGDTEKYLPWFSVAFFYIRFHQIRKRRVAGFVAVNDFSRGFGYDNDVIVFVNNVHFHK